jgi:ABC-type transport system substrate-binding protein
VYPYDPEKAKALLKEAGVATPLNVTLTLPPPPYARKGGEVLAAQLAKVGINAKIENVEWAQWLSALQGQLRPDGDQPRRAAGLRSLRRPAYYWGYDSAKAFRDLVAHAGGDVNTKERQAVRRHPAPAGRRRGQRLHLEPGPGGGLQEGAEGPVEQLADLRQRHGGVSWVAAKG